MTSATSTISTSSTLGMVVGTETGDFSVVVSEQPNDEGNVWGMPKYQSHMDQNLTDEEYLAKVLGPKNVGLPMLIPITFLSVVIFISGVVGNVAVCLVIVKNKSMHTATNYYLFSLAVSDLMILVLGLPNDLAIYWQQYPWVLGETLCRGRSLVSEMTSYSSVLTIVAFSMERYLAICHPLYSHTMSGFKRAVRIIALVWVVALLSAVPYALFTRLNYIARPLNSKNVLPQSAFCALLDENIYIKNYPVHELSSFIFFIFPMGILVILYIRMGLRIRETSGIQRNLPRSSLTAPPGGGVSLQTSNCGPPASGGSANNITAATAATNSGGSLQQVNSLSLRLSVEVVMQNEQRHLNSAKRSILRMLAAVVLAFFLCWAPFHAQRLSYVYFKESKVFRTVNEYLFYLSGFLYYLSATVNPILYNLMSLKYRHAFKQTLCGKRTRGGVASRRSVNNHRSYTFRSTTRTVLEGTASDSANSAAHSFISGARRGHGGHQSSGGKKSSRFGLRRCNSDSNGQNYHYSGGQNNDTEFCCHASLFSLGCSHANNSFQVGRRVKTRSDFRAAMRSAQNACSDIAEEIESSSSAANAGQYQGGLQMKKLSPSSMSLRKKQQPEMILETNNDELSVTTTALLRAPLASREHLPTSGEEDSPSDDCDSPEDEDELNISGCIFLLSPSRNKKVISPGGVTSKSVASQTTAREENNDCTSSADVLTSFATTFTASTGTNEQDCSRCMALAHHLEPCGEQQGGRGDVGVPEDDKDSGTGSVEFVVPIPSNCVGGDLNVANPSSYLPTNEAHITGWVAEGTKSAGTSV